eukprot:scaffold3266_cov30-Prasinocladus_malaysianus.AAC.1
MHALQLNAIPCERLPVGCARNHSIVCDLGFACVSVRSEKVNARLEPLRLAILDEMVQSGARHGTFGSSIIVMLMAAVAYLHAPIARHVCTPELKAPPADWRAFVWADELNKSLRRGKNDTA